MRRRNPPWRAEHQTVDAGARGFRHSEATQWPWNPPVRGWAVRCRYPSATNRGILRSLTLPLNDVRESECVPGCVGERGRGRPKFSVIQRPQAVESPMEGQSTKPWTREGRPLHRHPREDSPASDANPAKWIASEKEEQGSERSFRRKAEAESSGLCDDAIPPSGAWQYIVVSPVQPFGGFPRGARE